MNKTWVAGILVFATAAVAERAARVFETKPLDVAAPDGRIFATPKGFVVLEHTKDGGRIVHRDRTGKEILELAKAEGALLRWWAAPDAGAVAYVRDIRALKNLVVEVAGAKSGPTPAESESYISGEVAFSPEGHRLAFRSAGSIVARDASPDGWRVEIPSTEVLEGPFWSGDGKSLVAVTGTSKVVDGVLESSPDSIEWCDPKAAKPEWKKLFRSEGGKIVHLAADLSGRRVAFVEQKAGWKLRLFDLDKGELDVLDESGGTRSLVFTPAGDLLLTADTRSGRVEAWLIGTVRGGTKRGVSRDRVGDLPDVDVDAAAAAGGDLWLVTHSTGEKDFKVVRVTPK